MVVCFRIDYLISIWRRNMALMMIVMLVIFAVSGPGGHPMSSHQAPAATTQAHEHDGAKPDAGKHQSTTLPH